MKELYYYLRDKDGRRTITFCLVSHYGKKARGMSICSYEEPLVIKKGRDKAFGKAKKAIINKKTDEFIKREEAKSIINKVLKDNLDVIKDEKGMLKYLFTAKSVYQPTLLEFEKVLLNKVKSKRRKK